ncbi:TrmH family RNA methyltransferase [uncultured Maribacter sp.]|uniref:TrmH family RNA methyltransferase n=1 Tax=uncultured Maribacter sp. TaxID=431308 RepID=UPI0026024854|nr:TrmH family RNA methyltransferase [uncultured Maribacter sp.]
MVGKSQIKLIKSLQQKKCRNQQKLFVVEGKKTVEELLASKVELHKIFSTEENFAAQLGEICKLVDGNEMKQMSSLKNPSSVLGVFKIPDNKIVEVKDWVVVLDDVRDPGNLGTIIRLCDWFGIKNLFCSLTTVDCYNPKVLQATMGSISRMNIVYTDLKHFLEDTELPIYGAFMDGNVIYKEKIPEKGVLVMGNEANGVSKEIEMLCSNKISIPQFGDKTTESLNVATATSILLNEIRRSVF